MKCSIVRRVSSVDQAQNMSLPAQLKLCENSIQERKWTFVKDFNFGSTHGYELQNHPLYLELKRHIINNKCDVVLVAILDRALRDTSFWIDLCNILQQNGKLIASPSEIFDPANLEHEFTLNIKSAVGHYERKKIAYRAKLGLNETKDRGRWTGGNPPLGYIFVPGNKENPLQISESESQIIQEIIKLKLENKTKIEISDTLNKKFQRGKSGKNFTPRMIRRILEKPRLEFYAGLRRDSQNNLIRATWEPIISENQFHQLISNKKTANPVGWTRSPAYLLTGLGVFRCGYCSLSVKTAANRTKGNNPKTYYYCSGYYRGRDYCKGSKSVRIDIIDDLVLNDIVQRLKNWNVVEIGYAALAKKDDSSEKITQLNSQLKKLKEKKNNLLRAVESGALSLEDVKKRNEEISNNISYIKHEIASVENKTLFRIPIEQIKTMSKVIDKLPTFILEDKRKIIALIVDKIVLFTDHIDINYKFPIFDDGSSNTILYFR